MFNICAFFHLSITRNKNKAINRFPSTNSCNQCKIIRKKCDKLMNENKKLRSQIEQLARTTYCGICQDKLTQKELNQHVCISQGPISCEYCLASFESTIELRLHFSEIEHSNVTFYQCYKCGKTFATALLLEFHLSSERNHPNIQPKTIESPVIQCKSNIYI